MQIILLEDIRNLGKIGEVVKVKDGYGRNFLLKLGKALSLCDSFSVINEDLVSGNWLKISLIFLSLVSKSIPKNHS